MTILYPGTCLIEGTNVSEGRGTTRPFEYVGAPYIDGYSLAKKFNEKKLPGIIARPISFVPFYQKHEGKVCEGVQLHVTERKTLRSLETGLTLIALIAELYPDDFSFIQHENKRYFFDLLAGTDRLRQQIIAQDIRPFF